MHVMYVYTYKSIYTYIRIYLCIYIYIYLLVDARWVMIIIVGNRNGDPSSNPGRSCLHFT